MLLARAGLQGPRARAGAVSERHALHASDPAARGGLPAPLGPARQGDREQCSSRRPGQCSRPERYAWRGAIRVFEGVDAVYSPRRFILDALLVDAARGAGAEVIEGFTVEDVVIEAGRVVGVRGSEKGGARTRSAPPRHRRRRQALESGEVGGRCRIPSAADRVRVLLYLPGGRAHVRAARCTRSPTTLPDIGRPMTA